MSLLQTLNPLWFQKYFFSNCAWSADKKNRKCWNVTLMLPSAFSIHREEATGCAGRTKGSPNEEAYSDVNC